MRDEYDLKTLKVKRRGILPSLKGQSPEQAQLKITIALDDDLVNYFKAEAQEPDPSSTKFRLIKHFAKQYNKNRCLV